MGRLAGEIDEVFVDDSGYAVDGTVNGSDLRELAGFKSDADDALVDYWGGAAALGDENFSFKTIAHNGGRIAAFVPGGNPKFQKLWGNLAIADSAYCAYLHGQGMNDTFLAI